MIELIKNLPNPIDVILHPVSLIVFAMYGGLMIWEALFPARKLPVIRNWKFRGLIAFAVFFFLSTYFPLIWDTYLVSYQVFDLSVLGTYWGALVALLIYEIGFYVWHRTMHRSNYLWRVFHQMHHSAERLDTYSAFYLSPMDMIGFTFLGSLCLVLIAGFTPEATTLFILLTTFFSIFQHSNIRTPAWLGYIIQRPESHTVHHGKGIHAYNYSDLGFIDLIFGTFKNPKSYENETGFYKGGSARVLDMLMFKDISEDRDE
jgi:sterol desaturase/sphingolipid hydroxylase (fatty acid hydroxylase superfamily)